MYTSCSVTDTQVLLLCTQVVVLLLCTQVVVLLICCLFSGEVLVTTGGPGDGLDARSFLDKPRLLSTISVGGFINGITVL